MKKFLSSLLALTMILSLVIVPANAANAEIEGVSVSADSIKLKVGGSTILKVNIPNKKSGDTLKIGGEDAKLQSDITLSNVTSSDPKVATVEVDKSSNNVTVTAADQGTATITYTVSCNYKNKWDLNTSATQTLKTEVTVEPEKPPVTYTYEIGGSVAVTAAPEGPYKSGDTVTFTADTSKVTVTKKGSDNSKVDVSKDDYTLSYVWVGAEATAADKSKATATLTTEKPNDKLDVTCKVTAAFKSGSDSITGNAQGSKTINFVNEEATEAANQAKANADFKKAVTQITVMERTYLIKDGYYYTEAEKLSLEDQSKGGVAAVNPDKKVYADFGSKYTFEGGKLVVFAKTTVDGKKYDVRAEYTVNGTLAGSKPAITKPAGVKDTIYVGSSYTFTANYSDSLYGSTSGVSYDWDVKGANYNQKDKSITVKPDKTGKITITLTVTDHGKKYSSDPLELTVVANPYTAVATGKTEFTINTKASFNLANESAPQFRKDGKAYSDGVTGPEWKSSDETVAKVDKKGVVTGLKSGTATITATFTYNGEKYPVEYKFHVSALDCKLESVENGATVGYTRTDLMTAAEQAIYAFDRTRVDVTDVTVVLPSGTSYGTFYDDEDCGRNDKVTSPYPMDSGDELYFKSENGYVGSDVKVTLNVKTRSDGDYSVTAVIPVTMRKGEFESQVTGSDKTYKVTVPSGYEAYWVLSTSKEPAASEYDGSWATKTAGKYTSKSLYSFSTSNLKDGEGKLYIVAIDDKDNAYSGVIELKANAYTIKYTVTAGDSVNFKQEHFEDLLDTMFKDQNEYNSRNYTAEFDYVKFSSVSSGSSTSGWQLYDGSSKAKTSDKIKDLDDISFSAGSKLTGTVKIPFTLYADITKDSDGKTAKSDMAFNATVEITVVKEDIVYEVGVNSSVTFDSAAFLRYVKSVATKNTKLDYVTFEVGKNGVISSVLRGTGALYSSYTTYGVKTFAKATDKFYYEAKRNQDALDNVTYATTNLAKAGDVVYIPFTAVTDSGKEYTGTVAIKVKQTMNFVDVRPGDYFYDSVQWAVNLDITKGTSATTFSPKQGCTRAQIVTFLWRAAKSPEPRSNTSKFTDVYATAHADYMKAINWATEQGITTGTGNGKFSPDATCTRAQIVTFLYRFKNNPAVYGSLNFSDVNKTEHAAFYNAILWAVNNKITTGYGNGIFDPNGTCNRGDAVTFLYRALA